MRQGVLFELSKKKHSLKIKKFYKKTTFLSIPKNKKKYFHLNHVNKIIGQSQLDTQTSEKYQQLPKSHEYFLNCSLKNDRTKHCSLRTRTPIVSVSHKLYHYDQSHLPQSVSLALGFVQFLEQV